MNLVTMKALKKRMNDPVIRFKRALNSFILEKAYKPSYGTCWGKIGSVAELNVLIGINHYSDDRILEKSPELDTFRYGEPLTNEWQQDFAIYLHDLLIRVEFMKPDDDLDKCYLSYINGVLETLLKYENNYGPYKKGTKSTDSASMSDNEEAELAEQAMNNAANYAAALN